MSATTALPILTTNAWLRFDSIRRGLRLASPATVIEVGAGEAGLGAWLAARYEYTGVEPDDSSRAVASQRLAAVGRGRLAPRLDDVQGEFDLLCAFEVLEHIDDDVKALELWYSRVRPGGSLLLSVPAHARQWGPSDEAVGHFRRYERDQLVTRLTEAGFGGITVWSHGFGLGYALDAIRNVLVRRRLERPTSLEERTSASGRLYQPNGRFAATACAVLAAPFRAVQLPLASHDVGTGYVALAKRSQ